MANVNSAALQDQPLPERRSSGLVAAEAMMMVSDAMLDLEDAAAGLATLAANDATLINKKYYDPKTGELAEAQAKVVADEGTPNYNQQSVYHHTGWCYHYKQVEVTNPDGTTSEIWIKDPATRLPDGTYSRYHDTLGTQYHDPVTTYTGAASSEQTGDDTRQVSIITAQAQSAVSTAQTLANQAEQTSTNDGQQTQIDTNTLSSALGIMSTLTQLIGQVY